MTFFMFFGTELYLHVGNDRSGDNINLSLSYLATVSSYGPRCEKTCLQGFVNNTGADQPAHPRSLISAFVIR